MQLCCCNKIYLYSHYVDSTTKYVYDIFKDFQGLNVCNNNNVHLKWKTSSLDINTHGNEYNLAFDSSNYTFWATYVNVINEKVQVTQKVFTNLVEDAKSSCLGFFLSFSLCLYFCVFLSFVFVFDFVDTIEALTHAHSWAYGKVSNFPFDGCYGHLLLAILVSKWCGG